MSLASEPPQPSSLDLETLESDPVPTFVLKTGLDILEFDLLFCNEAFRREGFRQRVGEQNRSALLFRSWSQALGDYNPQHDFQQRRWVAQEAGKNGTWRIIRAVKLLPELDADENSSIPEATKEAVVKPDFGNWGHVYHRSKDEIMQDMKVNKSVLLKTLPRTNLTARWEGLQTMMEMSDVGVFEYNADGKLIHANEAWYKLRYVVHLGILIISTNAFSSHPRNLPSHVEYSFMDLVYPEDQTIVMSMWNNLASGNPVTFEMRWKAPPGSKESAQWVLSACVPVFDDEGNLISIAGNTIDIMAQKKSQEATQARVEALEQARLSEEKFARFAQLSPIAIYIFVPGHGESSLSSRSLECRLTCLRYELRQRSIFRTHRTFASTT
jgi:PAS domain-containing protein